MEICTKCYTRWWTKPVELDEQMEYLALESTKILGLDIGGVDLLYDGDSYKICEVNSSPGFNGMEKYTEIKSSPNR